MHQRASTGPLHWYNTLEQAHPNPLHLSHTDESLLILFVVIIMFVHTYVCIRTHVGVKCLNCLFPFPLANLLSLTNNINIHFRKFHRQERLIKWSEDHLPTVSAHWNNSRTSIPPTLKCTVSQINWEPIWALAVDVHSHVNVQVFH